ncbi:unnamed protein product, partial [Effrenium voratum]
LRDPLQRTSEERCPRSLGDSPVPSDGYGTGSQPQNDQKENGRSQAESRAITLACCLLVAVLVVLALALFWRIWRGGPHLRGGLGAAAFCTSRWSAMP